MGFRSAVDKKGRRIMVPCKQATLQVFGWVLVMFVGKYEFGSPPPKKRGNKKEHSVRNHG